MRKLILGFLFLVMMIAPGMAKTNILELYCHTYLDANYKIDLSLNKIFVYPRAEHVTVRPVHSIEKIEDNKIYFIWELAPVMWIINLTEMTIDIDEDYYKKNYQKYKYWSAMDFKKAQRERNGACNKLETRVEQTQRLKNECTGLGFKQGTDGHANCTLRLIELERSGNQSAAKSNDNRGSNQNVIINNDNKEVVEQMKRANEIERSKVLLDISDRLLTRPQSSARNCTTTVVGKIFNTRCN